MFVLGSMDQVLKSREVRPIQIEGQPDAVPALAQGESVLAGFDQGAGQRIMLCENLLEMQQIYRMYLEGHTESLNWYIGREKDVPAMPDTRDV